MKRGQIKLLILVSVILVIASVLWLMFRLIPESPGAEVEYARIALAEARDKKSETYSPKTYRQASAYYDSAMVHWKYQNTRFVILRDYERVVHFAKLSAETSLKAGDQTTKSSASLKTRIEKTIEELNGIVSEINTRFTRYPLSSETRNRIARGKLLLSEANVAFKKGAYLQANRKISDAEPLLRDSFNHAIENLNDYFKSYPVWRSWADKTIAESRQKKTAVIIVDKIAGKCYLYQNGVKTNEFDAELGIRWNGDKRHRGDKATPEGMYTVTKKLEGSSTIYYKALLINYPNEEDKKHFAEEIRRGTLPSSAKIGGLIEIHGSGGKGTDWTDGCVALVDSDMNKLYKLVKVGTPVTIVGSLEKLNSIKNN